MKIKLFTDLELLKKGYQIELLVPFIGIKNEEDKPGKILSGRFNDYISSANEFIELTTKIEECDACLLPIYYDEPILGEEFLDIISPFLRRIEDSGKKVLVFVGHDIPNVTVKIKNSIVFNSAINKSGQAENVYSWPHFFEDYIKKYKDNKLQLRQKKKIPVVGFCGYAPPLGLRFGKAKVVGIIKLLANYVGLIRLFREKSSHSFRARSILSLRKSKRVEINFRIKSNFAFGPSGMLNTGNTNETDQTFRQAFIDNIINSDYTLCVRGIGNNSVRFFETLCCGRIPVFLNTNCVLPFDQIIDWKNLCVWVEEEDIDDIARAVETFHNKLSEAEFLELQKKLRVLWEEYLSPVGFFKHLGVFIFDRERLEKK
jgi:hypothetical protein